jgi:hypothetical protein
VPARVLCLDMRKLLLCWCVCLLACSKSGSQSGGGGGCADACTKILGCVGVTSGEDQTDCVTRCEQGDGARVAQIARLGCDEIIAELGAQLGGGQQAAEQPAGGGCTADCTGCVGDGTSCYAAAGGAHGIPCDACCCSSGRVPVWK